MDHQPTCPSPRNDWPGQVAKDPGSFGSKQSAASGKVECKGPRPLASLKAPPLPPLPTRGPATIVDRGNGRPAASRHAAPIRHRQLAGELPRMSSRRSSDSDNHFHSTMVMSVSFRIAPSVAVRRSPTVASAATDAGRRTDEEAPWPLGARYGRRRAGGWTTEPFRAKGAASLPVDVDVEGAAHGLAATQPRLGLASGPRMDQTHTVSRGKAPRPGEGLAQQLFGNKPADDQSFSDCTQYT